MTAAKAERNKKDLLGMLPRAIKGIINEYTPNSPDLPLKKMAELSRQSRSNYTLFQPALNDAKAAYPLLLSVVQGNLKGLKSLVIANPGLLFKKGQITDLSGQTFYNVSAYQLMTFLCDDDMKRQIMSLMPTTYPVKVGDRIIELINTELKRRKQYAEIDSGGADLVKMNRDPTQLPFAEVTRVIISYPGIPTAVTFPLLENPDGIIYYQDRATKLEHLYYANQRTQTIELLVPRAHSKQEHQGLDKLYASFDVMENNSSRRSSNAEHQLIASTMQHQLSRKGIQYEHQGIRYCDSRIEFRLLNAYRTCIRLYHERREYEGDGYWRQVVGGAQRQVLWVLQRLCEPGRPFSPIPDLKSSPFLRGFKIYNYLMAREESLCSATGFAKDFGLKFAIYKGRGPMRQGGGPSWSGRAFVLLDLVAVSQFIADAKARVVECTKDRKLVADAAAADLCHGPGG